LDNFRIIFYLNKNEINIKNSPITPDNLGELILLIISDKISGKIAKEVFEDMFFTKKSANEIVEKKGLIQVSDTNQIESIIDEILNLNKDKVLEYKSGKTKLLGFFVGQAMKLSNGKVNPKLLNTILLKKLS
jgi:aspartyl-tRNA(Asn)/glutamyl-tRNA(Gln) amidotransferase subunit B